MKKDEKIGISDFKKTKTQTEKNRSPTKKTQSKKEIQAKLNFCQHELKIHIKNENHIMIGFKNEQIKDLEKKLKHG